MSKKLDPNRIDGVAVCKKTASGEVLSQNEECLTICGNRTGKICNENCMHHHKKSNPRTGPGTYRYESIEINGKEYDVLMLDDGNLLTTFLLDLSKKHAADNAFFQQFGLTQREMEIVELLLKHRSNIEIADKLCISPATLKTHINHIFKKVPRKYLKRNRENTNPD